MHPSHRKFSDAIGVVITVRKQHRSRLYARQEFYSKPIIVSLARGRRRPDRRAFCIDSRMNLAGQFRPVTVRFVGFYSS